MCRYAYTEIDYAAKIYRECTAPKSCQNYHNKHSARRIWNMSEWIFTGVKNILIGIINSKCKLFHVKSSNQKYYPQYTVECPAWISQQNDMPQRPGLNGLSASSTLTSRYVAVGVDRTLYAKTDRKGGDPRTVRKSAGSQPVLAPVTKK